MFCAGAGCRTPSNSLQPTRSACVLLSYFSDLQSKLVEPTTACMPLTNPITSPLTRPHHSIVQPLMLPKHFQGTSQLLTAAKTISPRKCFCLRRCVTLVSRRAQSKARITLLILNYGRGRNVSANRTAEHEAAARGVLSHISPGCLTLGYIDHRGWVISTPCIHWGPAGHH